MTSAPRVTSFALLVALGACSDDASSGTEDVAPDTIFVPDTVADTTFAPFTETSADSASETVEDVPDVADVEVQPDVEEPLCDSVPMPFFCPCTQNIDCSSGFCIPAGEDDVANRCSKACIDSCPEGWECRGIAGLPDPVFICQPPSNTLCAPCQVNANCQAIGARCLSYPDGSFCGRDCLNKPGACPDGYSCEEVLNGDGQVVAEQCQPTSGSCQCGDDTDYTADPLNCGFCTHACSFPGAAASCSDSTCHMGACLDGFIDLDRDEATGCEYACTFTSAEDWPDALCSGSDCDQNCDGIDGQWDRAIFVSAAGTANGTGSPSDPARSIGQGITLAQQAGKDHVYIAAGTYNEQVTLVDGISLFGGYSNDGRWSRNVLQYTTTITSSSGTASVRVVVADGILSARTAVDGLRIDAGTNGNPSGTSYAMWVRNSGHNLELRGVDVIGGTGGGGATGNAGSQGNPGGDPANGTTATDWDCATDGCGEVNAFGKGGAGGPNACTSGGNAAGGAGADARECDTGGNGGSPSPGGAGGGPTSGSGGSGSPGNNGQLGSGGTAGAVGSDGFWHGGAGGDGLVGPNGVGGGGGGSGTTADKGCAAFWSGYYPGGGGGGGGGGGCGGSPGGGGGAGKAGGAPGDGYDGGTRGGAGGKGGDGGKGGHGGGGAGGAAFGLYLSGTSDPVCANVSYLPVGSGGTGGIGGVGGDGSGNRGADGQFGERNVASPSCQ